MARTLRTKSETGIYHVMMRGVNHQIIFEQPSDYSRFQELLGQFTNPKDEQNRPQPPRCSFYAYCLMPNHVHLLIKEESEDLSSVVKRISAAYALYFNKKHERCGHLFQDRFKSEPVNDAAYFFTLLRYIHQNEPLAKSVRILDYDKSNCFASDDEVKEYLLDTYGLRTPADIQLLSKDRREEILRSAKDFGASIRQLERMTGVGFSIIRRA
jgi:REP element-mobilizing transposase RayT